MGRRRIKISQCWELDGYRVASAQVISDAPTSSSLSTTTTTANHAARTQQHHSDLEPPAGNAESVAPQPGSGRSEASAQTGNGSSTVAGLVDSVIGSCDEVINRLRSVMASRRVGAAHMGELMER